MLRMKDGRLCLWYDSQICACGTTPSIVMRITARLGATHTKTIRVARSFENLLDFSADLRTRHLRNGITFQKRLASQQCLQKLDVVIDG